MYHKGQIKQGIKTYCTYLENEQLLPSKNNKLKKQLFQYFNSLIISKPSKIVFKPNSKLFNKFFSGRQASFETFPTLIFFRTGSFTLENTQGQVVASSSSSNNLKMASNPSIPITFTYQSSPQNNQPLSIKEELKNSAILSEESSSDESWSSHATSSQNDDPCCFDSSFSQSDYDSYEDEIPSSNYLSDSDSEESFSIEIEQDELDEENNTREGRDCHHNPLDRRHEFNQGYTPEYTHRKEHAQKRIENKKTWQARRYKL